MKRLEKWLDSAVLWLGKVFYSVKVVDVEEHYDDRDSNMVEAWGAHALVSVEHKVLNNYLNQEYMVKVNRPDRLHINGEAIESAFDAIKQYFSDRGSKVYSITVVGEDGALLYYLVNHK